MFEFDEKHFYPYNKECAGKFPPEKPRFTLTEEIEHTALEMQKTIARLLAFEQRLNTKFEDMLKHITSDNVIFKETFAASHTTFIEAVKNEINMFEGNMDNSMALYRDTISGDYAKLSDECAEQIRNYYKDFTDDLAGYKAELNETYDNFRDAIEARISQYHDTATASINDYTTSVNRRRTEIESELNTAYATFTAQVNNTIALFKTSVEQTIDARFDTQDAKINDAVAYMKTNLSEGIVAVISEMENNGEFADVVGSVILPDFTAKVKDYVTPENCGAVGDGVADDTAAFVAAVNTGKSVYAFGTYKVTNVNLPKHLYGKATIKGNATISELNTHIEGIAFEGAVNWNGRNGIAVNCHFKESALNLNSWANCFVNCNWWKTPINFASVNGATNNFIACYFGGADKQFTGAPSNIHITNGWIEESGIVFELGNSGTVFGITLDNCDIESCENIVNCLGGVYSHPIVFSNCVILGNSVTTNMVSTIGTSGVTNNLSLKFANCQFESVKDFTSISNINLGIEGMPQNLLTKRVGYDGAVNVAWNVREPLAAVSVPAFEIEEKGNGVYYVKLASPCFVGEVNTSNATKIIGNRVVNGEFASTERAGNVATFNSTCYSFVIHAPSIPSVTLTTPSNIYGG